MRPTGQPWQGRVRFARALARLGFCLIEMVRAYRGADLSI
jgi:hypothetical protein